MKSTAHSHPASLKVFFATEIWERYGFYVVQTLLALYLALHFNWPDQDVYTLVGSFTALTYILPLIGGWVADQFLGQKRCIILGGGCLLVSYLGLSVDLSYPSFIMALAGVTVGTGLIKSNISSLLGNAYADNAHNRQRGFTIFYMGITTGIILGTTLPSYLQSLFGWPAPFASAAIGMLIGLASFGFGINRYAILDYYVHPLTVANSLQAGVILSAMWFGAYSILMHPNWASCAFGAVVLLSIAYLVQSARSETREQARKTTLIALLCCVSVLFWAFYFQMYLSFTLFILRVVQPSWHGLTLYPPYYVTVESISILIIGFCLTYFTKRSVTVHEGKRAGQQFTFAFVILTAAFALLLIVLRASLTHPGPLSPLAIVPLYALIAWAELLLSPVGLCTITVLSSRKKVSTMMGIFFVSLGIGGFLAGKLAALTAISNQATNTLLSVKTAYLHSFYTMFALLSVALLVTIAINQLIRHLSQAALQA